MTATVASEVYKAAQPALLYLVPFTLLPILVMAYLKVFIILINHLPLIYPLDVTFKMNFVRPGK